MLRQGPEIEIVLAPMTELSTRQSVGGERSHRCSICLDKIRTNPRLGDRQKTCGKTCCKKAHRAQYRREYRRANADAEKEYRSKRGADYWREYRSSHPEYVRRNRLRSRIAQRVRRSGLQRQLDILELVEFPDKISVVVEFATSTRSLWEAEICKKCG